MEKSWENFWTTGKVEDYLTYRNRYETEKRSDKQGLFEQERVNLSREREREKREHGTVGSSDGNGAFHHADFGLRQKNNNFDQGKR